MSIDCDAQLDQTLTATDVMDDAKAVLDPLQAEFDKYSTLDEDSWFAEADIAYRWAQEDIERVLADMENETKLLETAEAERAETSAKLDALVAENDALVLRLQELDDARIELEAEIEDLSDDFDPNVESLPAFEEAKDALAQVIAEFESALGRLDELAQEIGAAQDLVDHLDDEIVKHTDNLFELSEDFEEELAVVEETHAEYLEAQAAQGAAHKLANENGWGPFQENWSAYYTAKLAYDEARTAWTEELKQLYGHCPDSWEIFEDGDIPDEVWEVPIEPRDGEPEEEDPSEDEQGDPEDEEDEEEIEVEDVEGEDVEEEAEEDDDETEDPPRP